MRVPRPLIWMKSVGEKDRSKQDDVQEIFTVVTSRHHADGHADAGLCADVTFQKPGVPVEIVVGEADRHLLGVRHKRSHLDGKVGVVLAGKHRIGQFVQCLGNPGRMVLPDTENNALADLAA